MASIHVIYEGKNKDLTFEEVFPEDRFANLGIPEGTVVTSSNVTPDQVKMALAQYFDTGIDEFNDQYVELNPNGNIVVRMNTEFAHK